MRKVFCVVLLLVPIPAVAAEIPNTLTPQEIADGWVLLFDGESTFGWRIEGEAKVQNGILMIGGGQNTVARLTSKFCFYEMFFECRLDIDGKLEEFKPAIKLNKASSSGSTQLQKINQWTSHLVAARYGDSDTSSTAGDADGGYRHTLESPKIYAVDPLRFVVPAGTRISVRNVRMRPTEFKPIFTGMNLDGWKEVKSERSKSNFAVTPNGWLSIKNGPGDLQTVSQWDDFILQLDIKTNGKHLNSGVFFRCIPGQFWSGYESQIRNQWQAEDRTKPVDYGTGGIYNRQPARKVVSSDNEWFTKTIIAHGNHMAVWVNGYQVSDFTDTRPPSENARRGTKLGKGAISLQGHDPTTDLSFRNIRIAELPVQPKQK